MLMPMGVKVFLAVEPVDLRASFYRLAAYVRATQDGDPQNGHLYVFVGKSRNLVKILFWDRSGYCVFAKRLEKGRFKLPVSVPASAAQHEVDFATLTLFLEGIDLRGATRRAHPKPPTFRRRRGQT
jgi:transposase